MYLCKIQGISWKTTVARFFLTKIAQIDDESDPEHAHELSMNSNKNFTEIHQTFEAKVTNSVLQVQITNID